MVSFFDVIDVHTRERPKTIFKGYLNYEKIKMYICIVIVIPLYTLRIYKSYNLYNYIYCLLMVKCSRKL